MTTKVELEAEKAKLEKEVANLRAQVFFHDSSKREIAEAIWKEGREDFSLCEEGLRDFIKEHIGSAYLPGEPIKFFFGYMRVDAEDEELGSMLQYGGLSSACEWACCELIPKEALKKDEYDIVFNKVIQSIEALSENPFVDHEHV